MFEKSWAHLEAYFIYDSSKMLSDWSIACFISAATHLFMCLALFCFFGWLRFFFFFFQKWTVLFYSVQCVPVRCLSTKKQHMHLLSISLCFVFLCCRLPVWVAKKMEALTAVCLAFRSNITTYRTTDLSRWARRFYKVRWQAWKKEGERNNNKKNQTLKLMWKCNL